jgi:hypothetical protein
MTIQALHRRIHFLQRSNILYAQHTAHMLIFLKGGTPENPEKTLE